MLQGSSSEPGPLAGTRVIDLSAYLPGPYTTRLLADLGAEVIKVESPAGDPVKGYMPGVYEFLNRGKRVVTVDLKQQAGTQFVHALAATADVVVEAFRPGVVDRLGVGFEALSASAPHLVYCSISSHGQTGPARDRVGHNIGFEAAGGAYAPAVAAGSDPQPSPTALADTGAASFAALTICASLLGRSRESAALHLDVSLEEAVAYLAVPRWGNALAGADAAVVPPSASSAPGNGLFRTADGRHLALAGVEDHLWAATCDWLELPELTRAPFNEHTGRMRHREELRAQVEARIATRTAADWLASAAEKLAPVELARSSAEVLADEHLRDRRFVRDAEPGAVMDFPVRLGSQRSAAVDGIRTGSDEARALLAELALGAELEAALESSRALPDLQRLA